MYASLATTNVYMFRRRLVDGRLLAYLVACSLHMHILGCVCVGIFEVW